MKSSAVGGHSGRFGGARRHRRPDRYHHLDGGAPGNARIQPPFLVGATPGVPFLFSIPATGTAPLTYSATGLPAGLTLDASSGIISGTAPAAGSYPVAVTVMNGSGSASATLTITAGDTLALTPPMGWNSYDSYGGSVTEAQYLANAQALKTTLGPFGWNTAVIDYHWYDSEDATDANGRWLPSVSHFPSSKNGAGFKPIADQVHAMGLHFGIHIMRGIPQSSYKANTPIANSTYTAQQAGNNQDTTSWDPTHNYGVKGATAAGMAWYASIFAQYASWGLDFVKVDDCVDAYHSDEVHAIRAGIDMSGRSMVFSLSPGPTPTSSLADLNANANQWRIVNDFWDQNPLTPLYDSSQNNVFYFAGQWQAVSGLKQGHWPDPDMLPLGQLGSRQTAFSHNQQVTILTLWSILPAPLVFGGETTALANDAWTTALLANEEVLAIDQDPAGIEAKRIVQQGTTEVWARDLSQGRKAVALFNHATQDAMVSVTFSQLGVTGQPAVRDLWHRADVTGMTTGISVMVPHEAALLYTLSPPGGAGGSGGTTGGATGGVGGGTASGGHGGAAATGGAGGLRGTGGTTVGTGGASAGTGGASAGTGGASAGTGGASVGSTGGSAPATGGGAGGTPVAGAGGTPATGGTGTSGQGGSGGSAETSSGGCSCATAPSGSDLFGLVFLLAVALLSWRRPGIRGGPPSSPVAYVDNQGQ